MRPANNGAKGLYEAGDGKNQPVGGKRHTAVRLQQPASPVLYPIFQTNYIGGYGDGEPTFLNDVMAEGAPAVTGDEWNSWGVCPYPPITKKRFKP